MALVVSLPALYLLSRWLWNARIATVATALFATTPVAVGFSHLGYNNSQLYPIVLGALALLVWAHRDDSAAGFYLAGCVAGLGFYTYYPARLTPVLLLWAGWCLGAMALIRVRDRRLSWVFMALTVALIPVAVHPQETLGRMFQFTLFTAGGQNSATDLASAWQLFASVDFATLANQVFMSLIYSVYFVGPHHFQWPPVVDPISGPLVLVGLWLCLAAPRRGNAIFIVGTYMLSAALIGGTSHYFRPPLTRLLFLSPFAALLAAIALDRLASSLSRVTRSSRFGNGALALLTVAAVVWGIAWMQYNVRYRYHGYGDGTTAELIRLAVDQPDDMSFIYVQRIDSSMWSVDDIFHEYDMRERLLYFRGIAEGAPAALEKAEPPVMVVLGLGNESERLAMEAILSKRFPETKWQDSDPGQSWNLRYFVVPRN
jgi:4-amino-4-deoxy-L-arabinose transferase-like glycosyltransferase